MFKNVRITQDGLETASLVLVLIGWGALIVSGALSAPAMLITTIGITLAINLTSNVRRLVRSVEANTTPVYNITTLNESRN